MVIQKTLYRLLVLFVGCGSVCKAQQVNCDLIYFLNDDGIYSFDPRTEIYQSAGFVPPYSAKGLGITKDIFNHTDQLVMFTTVDDILHYYDGEKWVNTYHNVMAVNLAAGGDFIYTLDGHAGKIFKYDGTGDAKELLTINGFVGPFDMVGDNKGNFYVIRAKEGKLVHYSPAGKILKEYMVVGLTDETGGGGFAYRGNKIYGEFGSKTYVGTFQNGIIKFVVTDKLPQMTSDFASCPLGVFTPEKFTDTVKVDVVEAVEVDSVAVSLPDEVVFANENIPVSIKERNVELQSTITVDQAEFDIEVWDQSMVDGDSISLNLNGNWILQEYLVVKTKLKIRVKINPQFSNNYLILYAHNLGEFSPNTAAVQVLIGDKKYKLQLSSDLQKSGALNFSYVPK